MNIFALDQSPKKCAISLDDLRLRKMILETAQLLTAGISAHYEDYYQQYHHALYKLTHKNHPITKWVMSSIENFNWLVDYFYNLCDEYKFRFGKTHATDVKYTQLLKEITQRTTQYGYINFIYCGLELEENLNVESVTEKYKNLLIHKWKNDVREPKFTGRI